MVEIRVLIFDSLFHFDVVATFQLDPKLPKSLTLILPHQSNQIQSKMEEEIISKNLKTCTEKNHYPITELIVEKLPLPDYLRFAAVCQKWRSVQENHRLRFSPSQPPMSSPFPRLIPQHLIENSPLQCFRPFKQTFYGLRPIYTPVGLCMFSSYGWILFVNEEQPYTFLLINPITNVRLSSHSFPFPMSSHSTGSAPCRPHPPIPTAPSSSSLRTMFPLSTEGRPLSSE